VSHEPVLAAVGLGKRLGRREVFSAVDLEVWPGQVVGISGGNGSGKSTLMRVLSGTAHATAGVLRTTTAPKAIVPERFVPPDHMTPLSYLVHMGRLRGQRRAHTEPRALALLDELGVANARSSVLDELSKGNARDGSRARGRRGHREVARRAPAHQRAERPVRSRTRPGVRPTTDPRAGLSWTLAVGLTIGLIAIPKSPLILVLAALSREGPSAPWSEALPPAGLLVAGDVLLLGLTLWAYRRRSP
jgi:hypothetical protein